MGTRRGSDQVNTEQTRGGLQPSERKDGPDERYSRRGVEPARGTTIVHGDALDAYAGWPTPECIVSDGAYGVGGFPGDPRTPATLDDWYRPHVEEWSRRSDYGTTLWFWNTEIGWATVHPVLAANGWEYVQAIHWDKGIAHVAGNVNGKTIRRFPIANEICVFYQRKLEFPFMGEMVPARQWLVGEWKRTGLAMRKANEACGVKDAATRKYFAQDWLWYPPPVIMMTKLVEYANEHGNSNGAPYFSIDGKKSVTPEEWSRMRYRWTHQHGMTNVWQHPALHSRERLRGTGKRQAPRVHNPKAGVASAHLNQKPIEFMRRIVTACTEPDSVVWEPFGGLCTALVAVVELGRRGFAAEPHDDFFELAVERLQGVQAESSGFGPVPSELVSTAGASG